MHIFFRYRRILFVYLTFTLSIFSLFLFIISFCFSPFCLRFPVYFCMSNALVTVFSLAVFTAFRHRVLSRRSRTTLVSIVYLGSLFLFYFILLQLTFQRFEHFPPHSIVWIVHFVASIKEVRGRNCFSASLLRAQIHTSCHLLMNVLSNKINKDTADGHCYSFTWI